MHPRVTFIVPCYNYGRFVAQAVDSLLGQSFEAMEVLVIDDASTDDTPAVLARYADNERVRIIRHVENIGNILTYNEGIALARGDYVGICSADDYCLRPDAVERQVAMFDAHPDVAFVYSAYTHVDEGGTPWCLTQPGAADSVRPGLEEFADLLQMNYVPASGTLVRRSCHDELGGYDPRLPHAGDWDLWLRLAANYAVGYIADSLYVYRMHGTNMYHTRDSPRQGVGEVLLTVRKAFETLPPNAPRALRRLRSQAIRRALLHKMWFERAFGRTRRSWETVFESAWREPTLLASPRFHLAVARNVLLTALGRPPYERLAAWGAARRAAR